MQKTELILAAFTAVILGCAPIESQGTVYVSNIDETPTGAESISSDSWFAQVFSTGTDPDGYALNAVQLRMESPSGSPSGFEAYIYNNNSRKPGDSLGALAGPDPATDGVFTYAGTPITLSPSSHYFVVVTAATPVDQGSYTWSMTGATPTVGGWDIPNIGRYRSTDGSDWTFEDRLNVFQLAIDATIIPEPSTLFLVGLGVGLLSLLQRCAVHWLHRGREGVRGPPR